MHLNNETVQRLNVRMHAMTLSKTSIAKELPTHQILQNTVRPVNIALGHIKQSINPTVWSSSNYSEVGRLVYHVHSETIGKGSLC